MGESLAWTKGSLGLFPWMQRRWGSAGGGTGRRAVENPSAEGGTAQAGGRRLIGGEEAKQEEEEEAEKWAGALSTLIDTFTTPWAAR